MTSGIVFQVETSRVLAILAREIYDSPLALLRENVQNAYDAIRMRFATSGVLIPGGQIDVLVRDTEVVIQDNGIGMNEEVLRANFWKAGSSGKKSEAAQKAGVVGTFGIGAMANFGVSRRLIVETRTVAMDQGLKSVADRETLKLAEECISLSTIEGDTPVGTRITAILDPEHSISAQGATQYLEPYVALLPVPVYLNGTLISQAEMDARLEIQGRSFQSLDTADLADDLVGGRFEVLADANGQVLIRVTKLTLGGNAVEGSVLMLQSGGQLMGLRSFFGLAPIPASGHYQLGGLANLSFLEPTAGREAVSRESIGQVNRFINLAERAASEMLASTQFADRNNSFLLWLAAHSRYDLLDNVTIRAFPGERDIRFIDIKERMSSGHVHYYTGTDRQIINTFASENSLLLQVAQNHPRRNVQLHYVSQVLSIQAVPDSATVTRVFEPKELSLPEAAVLLRVASILRDDYLIADVNVELVEMSHGVAVLANLDGGTLRLFMSRQSSLLPPLLEFYDQAYELFTQFMKDFVRVHIYPRVQEFVPSSTRQGVDALRTLLQRNRELYRYEETEAGELEGVLGDFLAGLESFSEVLQRAGTRVRAQAQSVTRDQVGTVEGVVPDVIASPVAELEGFAGDFSPTPPILREEIATDMKILTTTSRYPQLNNFQVLLGLSDRLMRMEAEFFRTPHTTRILWGGHRVIYIFTEVTGRLSLYYDIELRNPVERLSASGSSIPTTTLITKKRIFVPVPDALAEQFRVAVGPREFFVRFDILTSDSN